MQQKSVKSDRKSSQQTLKYFAKLKLKIFMSNVSKSGNQIVWFKGIGGE